jgi:hypothetical protein
MKETPDWQYPPGIKEAMEEFEKKFEEIRAEVAKSGRNLVACRRARVKLQKFRSEEAQKLRRALFDERDKLEALRHGVTVDEWKRNRNRGS